MISDEAEAQRYCVDLVGVEGFATLGSFAAILASESQRQNLVAQRSLVELWRRHIADSLQLIEHVPRGTGEWLDLGSGGGFPGIVVAVARPETPVVLVEPRKLRADWLKRVSQGLELTNVEVLPSRVETVRTRKAAVISARAFAPLAKLLHLAARFSTPESYWVLPKGRSTRQELEEQPPAVQRMFHVEQSLTDEEAGILVGRGVPQLQ